MPPRPTARALARAWVAIGTQSVGGGSSTLFLIRRIVVERSGWVSLRDFTEAWALSQLSPGIHLVALAGLLGRAIAGWRGVLVSVGGMMLPAAVITMVLTAFFGRIAQHPLAVAALAGVGPITAGMTIGLALTTARPVLQRGPRVLLDLAVVAGACAILLGSASQTLPVIAAGGLIGALLLRRQRPTAADAPGS